MPEPRYFSIPSTVVGAVAFRNEALNWTPCVRSLIQDPLAWTNSPAEIIAAWPTRVMRSRWPRALIRSTQKPLSELWKVTRSTSPARTSVELAVSVGAIPRSGMRQCKVGLAVDAEFGIRRRARVQDNTAAWISRSQ